jgi:hypothetical protein
MGVLVDRKKPMFKAKLTIKNILYGMTASLILVPSVPAISQGLDVKVMPTQEKDKSQILIVQNSQEQTIKFKTGSHSAIVSGGIPRGTVNTYVLEANKGQNISVTITSIENNVVFQILDPTGKSIVKEKAKFSGKLPRSGKYKIVVGTTRGGASFKLSVSIK